MLYGQPTGVLYKQPNPGNHPASLRCKGGCSVTAGDLTANESSLSDDAQYTRPRLRQMSEGCFPRNFRQMARREAALPNSWARRSGCRSGRKVALITITQRLRLPFYGCSAFER